MSRSAIVYNYVISTPTAHGFGNSHADRLGAAPSASHRSRPSAGAVAMLAATVGAVALLSGCSSGSPFPPTAARSPVIRTLRFSRAFQPGEVVSVDGQVWLFGTEHGRCGVERVDPTTLSARTFPSDQCGGNYATTGGGLIYFVAVRYVPGTNDEELHIETFDPASQHRRIMAPVVTTTVGSDIAHMAFTYGNGSLWLYPWGTTLLRVSSSSGRVVGQVAGVTSGGGHAGLVSDPTATWMAEGPGGQRLFRIPPGAATASVVYRAPDPGSVLWVAAADGRIWADVATYSGPFGGEVTTRLMAFDPSGRKLVESPPEQLGTSLVAAGGELWSVGVGTSCTGPERLWRIDRRTARSVAVATLASPAQPCLTVGSTQLVNADGYVFAFDPAWGPYSAVLYRIAP